MASRCRVEHFDPRAYGRKDSPFTGVPTAGMIHLSTTIKDQIPEYRKAGWLGVRGRTSIALLQQRGDASHDDICDRAAAGKCLLQGPHRISPSLRQQRIALQHLEPKICRKIRKVAVGPWAVSNPTGPSRTEHMYNIPGRFSKDLSKRALNLFKTVNVLHDTAKSHI